MTTNEILQKFDGKLVQLNIAGGIIHGILKSGDDRFNLSHPFTGNPVFSVSPLISCFTCEITDDWVIISQIKF